MFDDINEVPINREYIWLGFIIHIEYEITSFTLGFKRHVGFSLPWEYC